ncbi:hypothetical protein, variant [Aphanomyces astaci]|nr:hypothetical protein, variant [Aphanomyces astaci]ETV83242.1 hypothetical protein, variant [Aphanomyces astaci]RHY06961.1 hypothetical protein DYB25_001306 [Aphanomyces astaci]RHY43779.1 hypothetical protein DYB30_010130 [Aphanomyces astaci]RHY96060.1 hypothetical protein DYB31_015636 [Aphanomyces astaci]RHZ31374.1 hypothetical protein DYB26_000816 [Aphanomyces astaci]|eukprot:XP_009826672.1 hypothetical protein, variant [Aphanomyces astaci]
MVGFGRSKKSTATFGEGIGQVDGSSLLDGYGEPTAATLYDSNNHDKKVKQRDAHSRNPEDVDNDGTKKPPVKRSWFSLGRSTKNSTHP